MSNTRPGVLSRGCAAALLSISLGCASTARPVRHARGEGPTYLLHLPGVAGDTVFDRWWASSLRDAGAADRAELYDWTGPHTGISALQAYQHNKDQAQMVADRIAARLRAEPRSKLILTSTSGGGGVAVWALERLPPDVQVQSVLLVAPALSPGYDLSAAMRHVRGKAYVLTSPVDVFILGFGTRMFGTMDGVKTEAAGRVGFRAPPGADPWQYRKVVELPYDLAWLRYFNFGDHTGAMSVLFARDYLAPLLRYDAGASDVAANPVLAAER